MIAVPSGILSTVLSVRYTGDGRFTARGVFFTHLFSILTIPLILKIMEVV
jgi:predicted permease